MIKTTWLVVMSVKFKIKDKALADNGLLKDERKATIS